MKDESELWKCVCVLSKQWPIAEQSQNINSSDQWLLLYLCQHSCLCSILATFSGGCLLGCLIVCLPRTAYSLCLNYVSKIIICCIFIQFNAFFFFTSLETSLIYRLFGSVLCSFQLFRNVPVVFLLLISSLIPLWSENKPCLLSVLLN